MKRLAFAAAALILLPAAAEAGKARCFTTDDGYFDCNFKSLDRKGSFRISSPGPHSVSILIEEPGFGFGFVEIGGRNIPIGGMFVRQRDDAACWSNPDVQVKICAW